MLYPAQKSRHFSPFFLFLVIVLAACSTVPGSALQPTPTLTQTVNAPTPTSVPPGYTSPPLKQDCNLPGSVHQFTMPTNHPAVGELVIRVYFPPCYDAAQSGYPLLVLLHGQTYANDQWERLGAVQAADELILSGQSRPFLMVMPYEEFQYRKPDDSAFEKAIISDVLPWAETTLGACASRVCRSIGGISRGASWAVRLGLMNWEAFGALGAHSLPTFNDDVRSLPKWINAIPRAYLPRVWLDTGNLDNERRSAAQFEQALTTAGVPHEWHLWNGRHDEEYWGAHVMEYITWYAAGWKDLP